MATPQAELDQIKNLVNQWLPLVGFSVVVGPNIIQMLADARVQTLYDLGQWMFTHGQSQIGQIDSGLYPWAHYGMNNTEYHAKLIGWGTVFGELTGNTLPPPQFLERAMSIGQGQMTEGEFRNWILTQPDFMNMYPWLKFGLDFQQFQQQKTQWQLQFGNQLTDQQAITQLQYLHTNQGKDMAVAVTPTFSQQEKKQANTGASQSEVR